MSKTMQRKTVRGAVLVAAGAVAAAAMAPGVAFGAESGGGLDRANPVITGLNSPRGLSVDMPRRLVYAQADGSISETITRGGGAGTTVLTTVAPNFLAPAVSQKDKNSADILTVGGEPGTGAGTLYHWTRGSDEAVAIADISAYEQTDPDPYDLEDNPTDTNPYGVESLPDGTVLVADAAGNDLMRVSPNGDIVTVARIKPRVVLVPDELEGQPGVPPPGTPIPAEGVATSVTVGTDGYYYLGELRGFPATPGTSEVWRIKPGAVDAVCDPEAPNTGDCQRFADGFTSIVDLAPGADGGIYVLELVKQSWLQWELGLVDPPIGALFLQPKNGPAVELAKDKLILPGGVDTNSHGKPLVAGPIMGDGSIARIR